jgi:hypothetical protein
MVPPHPSKGMLIALHEFWNIPNLFLPLYQKTTFCTHIQLKQWHIAIKCSLPHLACKIVESEIIWKIRRSTEEQKQRSRDRERKTENCLIASDAFNGRDFTECTELILSLLALRCIYVENELPKSRRFTRILTTFLIFLSRTLKVQCKCWCFQIFVKWSWCFQLSFYLAKTRVIETWSRNSPEGMSKIITSLAVCIPVVLPISVKENSDSKFLL